MIAGILHLGSGLGNQLHRYVATRVLALDKGYDFSMVAPENFKGNSFMDLDMGVPMYIPIRTDMPSGKVTPLYYEPELHNAPVWEEKTNYYNPEFNFIEDNTIIDGEFQSIQYFGHRLNEIDEWLKVEPLEIPDDVCVIGFRGGEFTPFPELFLTPEYWKEGIKMMLDINPDMKFEVHTDDPQTAAQFFPDLKITHDIGVNWRSMRYAKHAIIANSSFFIFPRLLRHNQGKYVSFDFEMFEMIDDDTTTIAPRYWARRNIKEWSRLDNFYRAFKYI